MVAELPLEQGAWRLDPTVHPFATAIAPSDIRITTRFDETYIGAALWAVIHEAGHGLYENGIAPELGRSPLCGPVSLGFHESQSRMWENWVGRGRPYLERLHPRLRESFPEQFGAVDPETLYRAANKVEASLIRVEADQVTYNLHIVMRFELELELFEGRLELADLPEAWNARTAEYLGLEVPGRRPRRAPGRALGGWRVRVLPDLLAGQPDRRPDLGRRPRGAAGSRRADRKR